MRKLNVAILGTGKLATDLLVKVLKSPYLDCRIFAGRNIDSKGIAFAKKLNVHTSYEGIRYLEQHPELFELAFDVTTAQSHLLHYPVFQKLHKPVIDLTPSHIGHMIVPTVNLSQAENNPNIGLISCGGQASLPMIHAISKTCQKIKSIEVVSSIAAKSAGLGTRNNIDEYIEKTESAITFFSGCSDVKAILILNPAEPEINMKTTIYIRCFSVHYPDLKKKVFETEKIMQQYVPGYTVKVGPVLEKDLIILSLEVKGNGDFLPSYAGNLDIINCSAITIAETFALQSNCHKEYASNKSE